MRYLQHGGGDDTGAAIPGTAPYGRVGQDNPVLFPANPHRAAVPPRATSIWTLANDFADEEAACCASLTLEVDERDDATVVAATF